MEQIEIIELSAPLFCENIGVSNINYLYISKIGTQHEKIHSNMKTTGADGVIIFQKSKVLFSNIKI